MEQLQIDRMKDFIRKWVFVVLVTFMFIAPVFAAPPKLVVMIIIDQGRHDYPLPRPDGYGKPPAGSTGYQTFLEQGTVYRNAFYAHSVTVTEPGHMTLVTGGNPDTHGIPRNSWLDRETGKFVNDIHDPNYWLLGNTSKTRDQAPGTAPTALLENTGTLGDRLIQATNGKAKVFSIGMWDWPTIPMAGGEGLALWYDATSGAFISSNYFYADLPAWVKEWNKTNPITQYYSGAIGGCLVYGLEHPPLVNHLIIGVVETVFEGLPAVHTVF